MKALRFLLFAALVLAASASASAATKADILALLPQGTPIVIIDETPGKTLDGLKSLAGQTPQEGGVTPVDQLFRLLGLAKAPAGLNIEGPAAVAMPQVPFPLAIVSVTDYDLFLEGMRGGPPAEGSPPPQPPVPGIDAVNLGGKPVFLRKVGDLALMTPMALLLAQPAGGGGLGATLHPGEREILEGGGSFARIDVAMLLTFLEPMIQQFTAGMAATVPPPVEGQELTEEQQAQMMAQNVLKAEVEILLAGLRQVRALSLGVAGGDRGSTLKSAWIPMPESGFADLLAKPAGTEARRLLRYFDSGAYYSGVFSMDASSVAGASRMMFDLILDAMASETSPEERREWEDLFSASFEMMGEHSAFSMGSAGEGGALSMLVIADVDDIEKMRGLIRDSFTASEKLLQSSPLMEESRGMMEMKYLPDSDSHRGIAIDRMSYALTDPEIKSEPAFEAYMNQMFGGPDISLWMAYHKNMMVASYYHPTPDGLKKLLDRILDGGEGDLTGSEGFREATADLPAKTAYFSYYSLPRMVESFAGAVTSMLPGETPPMTFGLGRPSGFGSAWYSSGDALRTVTFMPKGELENYRAMIDYFKSLGAEAKKSMEPPPPR